MDNAKLQNIDRSILQLLTTEQAWHYEVIPFEKKEGMLFCVAIEGKNTSKEELEVLLGVDIRLEYITATVLQPLLSQYYRRQARAAKSKNLDKNQDILDQLIQEAYQLGSSDIHIETYERKCRVRIRIDGELVERYHLDKATYPSLVNKIKIRANLDIAEKRLPQDGRIFFETNHQKFDLRISILPTLYGEKVVMRLLSSDIGNIALEELGFQTQQLVDYMEGIKRPNGIVLISGPTGSGKTTTLYATLHLLNETSRNITTIEDPIEYTLEGINQVQLKEAIGLDFSAAMRTFLRQDPNIIMVGEIRDKDTAEMAIRASLVGRLVLSTIHTNSAWGIIPRLVDMGIPAYLLADTLNTAVAQRLVRLLCPHCKEQKVLLENEDYPRNYKAPELLEHHYTAKGCDHCYYTGYKGRKAVYEIIPIDEDLVHLIKQETFNVKAVLKEKQITTLADNAFELLKEGLTSMDEIYPILASR
ncbi:GspE/PulE family protein [Aureispira anguillae]|uniref:GspE/PulE family protein n=1 Tax=Aureispira anguillae TaxID=2864201 RepID=A0A915YJF2_9BACT|nr:GspE/PulE family protein [Aureispira anguillae]BDS14308.1 GspE/PulE family protein [Aureispira anguillae]